MNRLARLSPREREVLHWLAFGLENKEIAAQLGIKESTVKGYVEAIFVILDVHNRTQAALLWLRGDT